MGPDTNNRCGRGAPSICDTASRPTRRSSEGKETDAGMVSTRRPAKRRRSDASTSESSTSTTPTGTCSPELPPVPSRQCLICGDKATGLHYGVLSCEGCKGFFMRSVLNRSTYKCKNHGRCVMNKRSRNRCQYCRLSQCLKIGMNKGAIREDRMPGGRSRHVGQYKYSQQKMERILSGYYSDSDTESAQSLSPSHLSDGAESIECKSASDARPICQCPQDILDNHNLRLWRLALPRLLELDQNPLLTVFPNCDGQLSDGDMLSLINDLAIELCKRQSGWVKNLPIYGSIPLSDIASLTTDSFFEVTILSSLMMRRNGLASHLRQAMTRYQPSKESLQAQSKSLTAAFYQVCSKILQLRLTMEEFACLKALSFLQPDRLNCQHQCLVSHHRDKYENLVRDISSSSGGTLDPERASNIIKVRCLLTAVSAELREMPLDDLPVVLKCLFNIEMKPSK
ncbi:nuclear receptor subfamily 6 group A member 1-B [Lingula anatina]|uniref:Nuclear receptor subfamily 6 group A member 1-B n=1 Tax=Lingula anatina TaxID=7574 RepID=A0A1S3K6K2_LINAN|nr:nuclear receptor subfamily 6 group A member 1-B [Lingula anatina]|eukprot:XP_013418263.1 nuclear receptor subfamily 6 group A member 1-B [Lingula anatina]